MRKKTKKNLILVTLDFGFSTVFSIDSIGSDSCCFIESVWSLLSSVSSGAVVLVNLSSVIVLVRIPGWPGCGFSDDLLDVDSLLGVVDVSCDDTGVGDFARDIEPDREDDCDDDGSCCATFSDCFVETVLDELSFDADCWFIF